MRTYPHPATIDCENSRVELYRFGLEERLEWREFITSLDARHFIDFALASKMVVNERIRGNDRQEPDI